MFPQKESIVKLIGSNGIGLFFVVQNLNDVSVEIMEQQGLKVKQELRAFIAKDTKFKKLTAENYSD